MPMTTYPCGHTWRTGLNGTAEEQERLRKIVERWSKTQVCIYCQNKEQFDGESGRTNRSNQGNDQQ